MKIWVFAILIFCFAISFRLWNLNMAGRWSDEEALVSRGYSLIELIKDRNFSTPYWYTELADHPPLFYYIYGLVSYGDIIGFKDNPSTFFKSISIKEPIYSYDFNHVRALSIILSSLTVVLVFLIGVRYFSLFIGVTASIVLAMIPHFLGFSQYVDAEISITLFFTLCVIAYLFYLEKRSTFLLIMTGILSGLCVEVKQSNVLIFLFYIGTFYVWKKYAKNKKLSFLHLIKICLIAFIVFVAFWPIPWLHMPEFINTTHNLWFKGGLTPDLMFGKVMGAHFFYYIVAFFITTPVVIIILTFLGMKASFDKRKKWIYSALLIWFFTPFLMMFFHHRQNMIRYIVEFYVPLSLLAALGLEYLVKKVTKRTNIKYIAIIPLFIYLFSILWQMTPYYLEYYNELVGGTKNVYEKRLFFLGWFGEGLKGPSEFVAKHAEKGAKIGLEVEPYPTSVDKIPTLRYEVFNKKNKYDYVIVNYYSIIRVGFDEKALQKDYDLVYTEKADSVDLVHVFKHK